MKGVQRFGVKRKLAPRYIGSYQIIERKGNVTYKLQLLMGTGIPIFRQVLVTIVVAENDTPIRLQIERSNPAILAPQLLWLSTKTQIWLTSPRRLIPAYATKNTSKNKKESNQITAE